jgi:PD-(D/E)XK nuclease family transposase
MNILASLDNEIIFKKAFTDKLVFETFVEDILGIQIKVSKIETEKQFNPKIGNIDFKLDIFAESEDKRIVIEIQRVEYDRQATLHNFDRFLHYFLALIIEQQKTSKQYGIDQTVYAIIVMTEPFTISDKSNKPVRNEVLLLHFNPKNLLGEEIDLYGHQFVVLNPNHPENNTPQKIRDWLDLIYQSIHNPDRPVWNRDNQGIRRAVELISYDNLSPQEVQAMKNTEASKTAFFLKMQLELTKIIINLHKEGMAISAIARITETSDEDVQRILDENYRPLTTNDLP